MFLKKITLQGFKSFADKVEIEFLPGVVAIVGPNGCGKSNVSDSIRWVLGDNSAKTRRGADTMADVIFNGTAFRKSLSYCEVSLHFDNTDRGLPEVDADEVTLTRRLYKSSGSEYCINGQQVKLKDIVEMFRETGLGKEGYSVIEQGRTTELLSKKPEDRRKVFEGAAGIATFRARKEEAEKQLAKTRIEKENLYAFITKLTEYIGPLEKQAKDAIKVRELRDELKVVEVNTYLYQSEDSTGATAKLTNALKKIEAEISEKEQNVVDLTKKYNLAFADFTNSGMLSTQLTDQRTELMVSRAHADSDNVRFTEKIERATKELKSLEDETTANLAKIDTKTEEVSNKELLKANKFKEYTELNYKYKKQEEEFKEFSATVSSKEKELERSRELIFASHDAITKAKTSTVSLIARRDVLLASLGDDKDAITEQRSRLNEIKKGINKLNEELDVQNKELGEKIKDLEVANSNLRECLKEVDETHIGLREKEREILEIETRINWLAERKDSLDNYQEAVRNLIRASQKDLELNGYIVGVVGESITVPRDLQVAIEVALGGNIQNIITHTQKDAAALIDYLRENNLGRATFLPLDVIKRNDLVDDRVLDDEGVVGVASDLIKYDHKLSPAISNLLGKTVIVETKDIAARVLRKYNFAFKVVTLDGAVYQQSGAITGGKEPTKDTRILGRDAELEECKKKRIALTRAIDAIKEDVKDKEDEKQSLTAAKNIIATQIEKINIKIATIKAEINLKNEQYAVVEEDERQIAGQNQKTVDEINELERLIEESSKAEENVESQKVEATDVIENMKNDLFELRQKRDYMSEELADLKVKASSLDSEVRILDQEIVRLASEIASAKNACAFADAKKLTLEKEIVDATNSIATTSFSKEDQQKIDDLTNQISQIKTHNDELQTQMTTLMEERDNVNNMLEGLRSKRAAINFRLEKLNEELLQMQTKITEEYHLSQEDAEQFRVEGFDVENAIQNANKIKRRIESYGAINELAVEDFAEKSKELIDYRTNYDDIEKAENDIVSIIADLTKEMESRFVEAFEKIKENFKRIYAELSEGGKGDLILNMDEIDSPLLAPIDILAVPKGKNLKSIMQLSGGEQALAAIAVLFAIIQLRPVPFCILDEVDAAMDDGNAALFARYLKKYTGNTQFIVITHKKVTMQEVDYLYGVTMQEVGVSSIVSVKLKDAYDLAEK